MPRESRPRRALPAGRYVYIDLDREDWPSWRQDRLIGDALTETNAYGRILSVAVIGGVRRVR